MEVIREYKRFDEMKDGEFFYYADNRGGNHLCMRICSYNKNYPKDYVYFDYIWNCGMTYASVDDAYLYQVIDFPLFTKLYYEWVSAYTMPD